MKFLIPNEEQKTSGELVLDVFLRIDKFDRHRFARLVRTAKDNVDLNDVPALYGAIVFGQLAGEFAVLASRILAEIDATPKGHVVRIPMTFREVDVLVFTLIHFPWSTGKTSDGSRIHDIDALSDVFLDLLKAYGTAIAGADEEDLAEVVRFCLVKFAGDVAEDREGDEDETPEQ